MFRIAVKPWQSSCKKYFPQRFLPGPVVISHAAEGILIPEPNVARNNPKCYFSTLAQRLEYLMLYLMKEKLEMAKKLVLLLLVTHQMSANVIRRDTLQTLLQPNSASENAFNQSSIVQAPLATTIGATNTMLLENVSTESFSVETAQSLFSSNEPMTTELFTASTQVDLMSTNLVLPESPESVSTCNVINCRLPSCRCAGTDIPGGLSKVNTPQMILLTMDDGVTPENYQLYSELLNGSTNFNGCPIKATFLYLSTKTTLLLRIFLYFIGHEIADHSATHKLPEEWWSNTFVGNRSGIRWWPYTLDYLPSLPCYMANCPTFTYPGVWEIPLITLQCDESATTFATMLDECTNLETEESTYNMLMTNFKLHYEDNKQPFPMFGHSTWFDNASYRKDAVIRFMNDVRKFSDVYFVTAQQAIEWIKSPAGLDRKGGFSVTNNIFKALQDFLTSFILAFRHKLIPSVNATCIIDPNKFVDAVSYSGLTYIAIRSIKHDSSTAFIYGRDLERLVSIENFNHHICTPEGQVKPIFVVAYDGGPDENPRFPKPL
ncbi:uncharacterized protein LOC124817219 [Hydra vulgaris]|uniref:uncharacterized protein LOC124817219 n=1 Tax=Hydra vulgaris TaxID=6087 RepID=UPI0032E9F08B